MARGRGFRERVRREIAMVAFRGEVSKGAPLSGVAGTGRWRNPEAMIVQGRPGGGKWQGFFEKRSGPMYLQILKQEKIDLDEIYITSALKTRPGQREVTVDYEMVVWRRYLEREIQLVRPKTLILVGHLAKQMMQDAKELKRYGRKIVSA